MKKIAMCLVVLLAAAPAMAVVNVTATQVGTTAEVDITATHSGEGTIPRAYALDITVDAGQIKGISNFFSGEGTSSGSGYGIFPANFNRFIDADDPCWGEPNYTPVADACDLPSDTQGGLGTAGITIEMGSLYTGGYSPPSPSTLCRIEVTQDCNVDLALNIGRGKIVLEDGNEPSSVVLTGCHVDIVCTVPNIYNMTKADANAAIEAAGFQVGDITGDCNDVIVAGNVTAQLPAAGAQPECGTTVDYEVSTGLCDICGDCPMDVSSYIPGSPDGFVGPEDLLYLKTLLENHGPYIPSTDSNFNVCLDQSSYIPGTPDGFNGPEDLLYLKTCLEASGPYIMCPYDP